MTDDIATAKARIRREARARLSAMRRPEHAARSARICQRLTALPAFQAATAVMVYGPIPGEVDVAAVAGAVLAEGKRLCLPRADWGARAMQAVEIHDPGADLVPARYGIREPRPDLPALPVAELGLVLVPGLAFDARGNRLGRGAGFYDRFLADPSLSAPTCGVCYEAQLFDDVPVDPWDIPLNLIATEDRLIQIS